MANRLWSKVCNLFGLFPKLSRTQWIVAAIILILITTLALVSSVDKPTAFIFLVIALTVLLLWWLIDRLVVARQRRLQSDFDAELGSSDPTDVLRNDWQRAVDELKSTGIDRYNLAFYLLIGETAAGKTTTLKRSGLNFPIGMNLIKGFGGTTNCNWWFTDEAVILDTAGRFTFQHEEGVSSQASVQNPEDWHTFLKLTKKYRPKCPINGVIVALPCDALLNDSAEERERKAQVIRNALVEIERTLEIRYPVYVLLTKADMIGGFVEFFGNLRAMEQAQLIGWSRPPELHKQVFNVTEIDDAFADLVGRFRRWRILALQQRTNNTDIEGVDRLFPFPEEFQRLRPAVAAYMEAMFPEGKLVDSLFLRGFYLTSGVQRGASILHTLQEVLEGRALPPQGVAEDAPVEERAFFIRDFYRKKVLKEPELIQPTRALVRRVRLVRNVGYGVALAAGVIGVTLLYLSWSGMKTEVDKPTEKLVEIMKHALQPRDKGVSMPEILAELLSARLEYRSADEMGQTESDEMRQTAPFEKTLSLLRDLYDVEEVASGKDDDDDAHSLLYNLENNKILAPVWIFRVLDEDRQALKRNLWETYRRLAITGLADPFRGTILDALKNITPDEIGEAKDFKEYQDALVAFMRLAQPAPDVDYVKDHLAVSRRQVNGKPISEADAQILQDQVEDLDVSSLFNWVRKHAPAGHFLRDESHCIQVAGVFNQLRKEEAGGRFAGETGKSLQGTGFGSIFLPMEKTGEMLKAALKAVNDRWKLAFRPLENEFVTISAADCRDDVTRWWLVFGGASWMLESGEALKKLQTTIAESDTTAITTLHDFQDKYAGDWDKSYSAIERALPTLRSLAENANPREHGTPADSIDATKAADRLEDEWNGNFYLRLEIAALGIHQDLITNAIRNNFDELMSEFKVRRRDLVSFGKGDNESSLNKICTITRADLKVYLKGDCEYIRWADGDLKETSRLMRIAVDARRDNDKESGFSRFLKKDSAFLRGGPGSEGMPLKRSLETLPLIAKGQTGGYPSEETLSVRRIALKAANSNLLGTLTAEQVWDEVIEDLNRGEGQSLVYPHYLSDKPVPVRELQGCYSARHAVSLFQEFVSPIATYAADPATDSFDGDASVAIMRLDGLAVEYCTNWWKQWTEVESDFLDLPGRPFDDRQAWLRNACNWLSGNRDRLVALNDQLASWRNPGVSTNCNVDALPLCGMRWLEIEGAMTATRSALADEPEGKGDRSTFDRELDRLIEQLEPYAKSSNTNLFYGKLDIPTDRVSIGKACDVIPGRLREIEGQSARFTSMAAVHRSVGVITDAARREWSAHVTDKMRDMYKGKMTGFTAGKGGFPFFDGDWGTSERNSDQTIISFFEKGGSWELFQETFNDQLLTRIFDDSAMENTMRNGSSASASMFVEADIPPDVMRFFRYCHLLHDLISGDDEHGSAGRLTGFVLRRDVGSGFSEDSADPLVTSVWWGRGRPQDGSSGVKMGRPGATGERGKPQPVDTNVLEPIVVGSNANDAIGTDGVTFIRKCLDKRVSILEFKDGPYPTLEFLLEYAKPRGKWEPSGVEDLNNRRVIDSKVLLEIPVGPDSNSTAATSVPSIIGSDPRWKTLWIEFSIKDAVFPDLEPMPVPEWP